MIALDMKSVVFANIIINIVCLIVMLQLWRQNQGKYAGLNFWVIDWALQVGGTLLIALRGSIPNWASMVLSNSMIVGGTLILYFGLCRFAGQKTNRSLNYFLLLYSIIFVFVHIYFTYVNDELLTRSINSSIGLTLGCFLGMWLMLKGVGPEIRAISRGTGLAFAVVVLISLIRILDFLLLPQTNNDYFQTGLFDTLMVLLLVGSIVFLTFNLVLMVNRRLYLETKRMEEAVVKSERELQATFNATSVGFAVLVNRAVKEVNEAACKMLGYSHTEIIGKDVRIFYATEEEYQLNAKLYPKIAVLGTITTEMRFIRKDGQLFYAIMSISAFDKNDLSLGVVLSLIDITERKRAEAIIGEQNSRLLSIINSTADILIFSLDRDYCYTVFNEAHRKMMSKVWSADINIGMNLLECMTDPEPRKIASESINRVFAGEHFQEIQNQEVQNIWFEFNWNPISDQNGAVIGVTSFIHDITERKRLEQERDRFIADIKEKNVELERFSYTVSHDLKSPLVTVKTFLGYLKQDITASDAARIEQDLLYINGAADKMGKLLDELLEMSRIGRIVNPPMEVSLQELVQETLLLVAGRIEKRGVKVEVSGEPVTLYGDRSRLVEIWQNLVENAVKFMGDQASPQIETGVERRGQETVFFVRDNGIGIDPQYQPRLFNLFEKINPGAEGAGMGLAIVKRIVELYKGRIWVESQGSGKGTCFWFTLPGALKDKGKGGQT